MHEYCIYDIMIDLKIQWLNLLFSKEVAGLISATTNGDMKSIIVSCKC